MLVAALANGLVATSPAGVRAQITLTDVASPRPARTAQAVVRIDPAAVVDRPAWLTITSWQGGGLYVNRLVPVGDGSYRTTKPIPLSGDWKALVRLHDGRILTAVPIYLPADEVLGEPEIPALGNATRDAINEKQIMQRELKEGVPDSLWATASAVVLVCALVLVLALGWGVSRVSRASRSAGRSTSGPVRQVAAAP